MSRHRARRQSWTQYHQGHEEEAEMLMSDEEETLEAKCQMIDDLRAEVLRLELIEERLNWYLMHAPVRLLVVDAENIAKAEAKAEERIRKSEEERKHEREQQRADRLRAKVDDLEAQAKRRVTPWQLRHPTGG